MVVKHGELEYFYGLEQGSQEWLDVRKGLCTASEAATGLMAAKAGFATYLLQKESERFLEVMDPGYMSSDMFRGKELEPIAKQLYAEKELVEITEVGFIRHLGLMAGLSPDGIVRMHDKGLEIKCLNSTNHYRTFKEGAKSDHVCQVMFSMAVTGYKSWDLVYYNPDFVDDFKMNIITIERNDELCMGYVALLRNVKNKVESGLNIVL